MPNLHSEFQLKMSMNICMIEIMSDERKLKIIGIFPSPRGIALPKINQPEPNANLAYKLLMTHPYSEFKFKFPICNGERLVETERYWNFFYVQGA